MMAITTNSSISVNAHFASFRVARFMVLVLVFLRCFVMLPVSLCPSGGAVNAVSEPGRKGISLFLRRFPAVTLGAVDATDTTGLTGRKLGILIAAAPEAAGFRHGLGLAEAALRAGVDVYCYCLDDAVTGVLDPRLQALRGRGLKLFACAYGADRRNLPLNDLATFAGLTVVSDLIASTDRVVCFN